MARTPQDRAPFMKITAEVRTLVLELFYVMLSSFYEEQG